MRAIATGSPAYIRKYARFAAEAVRRQGWIESAADLMAEACFDLRHRSDTFRPRELDGLATSGGNREDAVQYQAAAPRLVRELFRRLPADAFLAHFVDFGCGKGRGLMLAAEAGFLNLTGVEFAPELATICRRNLAQIQGPKAAVFEMDASRFAVPESPTVAFLYNPFLGETLARVAAALSRHALRHPVWVIYLNPRGLETFLYSGFRVRAEVRRRTHLAGVVMEPAAESR